MKLIHTIVRNEPELLKLASRLAEIAIENKMQIETCAEKIDLSTCEIMHGSCIDKELIENIIGFSINTKKDKNQREECGCVESVEVGAYNTCPNGCKYCYANDSKERVQANLALFDVYSPLLCGEIFEGDKITERAMKSIKKGKFL